METLKFEYPAAQPVSHRAHVGVVSSGDLEVLLEPSTSGNAIVSIRTSVDGYGVIWKALLDRFFSRYSIAAVVEINDFGATPGTALLRLEQAVEAAES